MKIDEQRRSCQISGRQAGKYTKEELSVICPHTVNFKVFMRLSGKIQDGSCMEIWKFTLISVLKLRINIKCTFFNVILHWHRCMYGRRRVSLVVQTVKNSLPQCGRPEFDPWVGKMFWRRAWQPTLVFLPGESPWTEKPGGLQSMGLQRVGHDWANKHTQHIRRGRGHQRKRKLRKGKEFSVAEESWRGGFLQIELLEYLESCPTFSWEREWGRLESHFKPCDGSFKDLLLFWHVP